MREKVSNKIGSTIKRKRLKRKFVRDEFYELNTDDSKFLTGVLTIMRAKKKTVELIVESTLYSIPDMDFVLQER